MSMISGCEKYNFSVVRFTPRFNYQSDNISYCTLASQVIRFARICNNIDGRKLIRTFKNCINRHKFNDKFSNIVHILSLISN